jgi:rhamnosyl/mannosyltransferase
MIDVVHVYKDFPPVLGGIENHIAILGRFLARRGVEVHVLCSRHRGFPASEDRDGVRVERCCSPLTLASTPLPPGLPLALSTNRARIVHLHYPWPPGEVAWLIGGRRRPLVVSVHCEVVRYPRLARALRPMTDRVLNDAAVILVATRSMGEIPLLARHRNKVRLVPYGIDVLAFRPGDGEGDPLPDVPHPRLVFVGRLRHYKGLPVLAAALSRLPAVQLVVVGEGPERHAFEIALRQAGCRDRTRLLGEVGEERLVRVLQHADAAVLPSTSNAEAFGIAIAEAQSCGIPAVVTDVGTGTVETVADGSSGRVVAPHDAEALATGIAWCLATEGREQKRRFAREHALQRFDATRMAASIHALYDSVAAEASPLR